MPSSLSRNSSWLALLLLVALVATTEGRLGRLSDTAPMPNHAGHHGHHHGHEHMHHGAAAAAPGADAPTEEHNHAEMMGHEGHNHAEMMSHEGHNHAEMMSHEGHNHAEMMGSGEEGHNHAEMMGSGSSPAETVLHDDQGLGSSIESPSSSSGGRDKFSKDMFNEKFNQNFVGEALIVEEENAEEQEEIDELAQEEEKVKFSTSAKKPKSSIKFSSDTAVNGQVGSSLGVTPTVGNGYGSSPDDQYAGSAKPKSEKFSMDGDGAKIGIEGTSSLSSSLSTPSTREKFSTGSSISTSTSEILGISEAAEGSSTRGKFSSSKGDLIVAEGEEEQQQQQLEGEEPDMEQEEGGIVEQMLESDQDKEVVEPLRFLVFGSPVTWGSALEFKEEAYPNLLPGVITNFATSTAGPNFPSVCTESMVGQDAIYDVIILEFFIRAPEGLGNLARRLRMRFPDALIIFVQLWSPRFIRYSTGDADHPFLEVHQFQELNGLGDSIDSDDLKRGILESPKKSWQWMKFPTQQQAMEDAAKEVDGHVLVLHKPEDPRAAISRYGHWFANDYHSLSEHGHQSVAHGILDILGRYPPPRNFKKGTWGDGDACYYWYNNGQCNVEHETHLQVARFDYDGEKFALEIQMGGGEIIVNNPFDSPRGLYIAHMGSFPAPGVYPETRVVFPSADPPIEPAVLEPTIASEGEKPLHEVKTCFVATIPPGEILVRFNPVDDVGVPFRLVGVIIAGEENPPDMYNFEHNPAALIQSPGESQ